MSPSLVEFGQTTPPPVSAYLGINSRGSASTPFNGNVH